MKSFSLSLTALFTLAALVSKLSHLLESKDNPSNPGARIGHALAYDEARGRTMLFRGWDGREWTELRVVGPSKRYVYSMAYDGNRKEVLFFGGGHREPEAWVLFDETWVWNGSQWQRPSNE